MHYNINEVTREALKSMEENNSYNELRTIISSRVAEAEEGHISNKSVQDIIKEINEKIYL